MSEFEDKLNAILSNPDAMAQVMGLAQSLSGSGVLEGSGHSEGKTQENTGSSGGGMGGFGDLFSQLDPNLIKRLLPLLGELNQDGGDERLQLLYALRPFLKPERRDKIERAVKAAKLIRVGKKFLTTMGDGHV